MRCGHSSKKQQQCASGESKQGDCWIALSVAYNSGVIVSARVGKHTDTLLNELLVSNQGKTDCLVWKTDEWGGYDRILPEEVEHWLE
jgi:insertion element IS1 protein InsB